MGVVMVERDDSQRRKLSDEQLRRIEAETLDSYGDRSDAFWRGTRDHDVSQNIEALLDAIEAERPFRILDLGCGPGRDLIDLRERGHDPVGLDGVLAFVEGARERAGVPVLRQSFLSLDLAPESFDGVFANASLFHVPGQELPRVLSELFRCLRPGGVLFSSNPRGGNEEGWNGDRYGAFHDYECWHTQVTGAGFEPIRHYYRPTGLPRERQPWLASLWRRPRADSGV